MALIDRERRNAEPVGGDIDRHLLAVAVTLAALTLLAILDLGRPVPGSAPPVVVRIPPVDRPLESPPVAARRPPINDDLLAHD